MQLQPFEWLGALVDPGGIVMTLLTIFSLFPVVLGNSMQNSSLISKEFLRRLKNTLSFTMSVDRQYDGLFAGTGTKPGVTVNLRKPPRFAGRRGQEAQPEAIVDNLVPLTINTQYGQDVVISSQEEALNLQDYSEQVTQPAMEIIANMIDSDGLQICYQDVPQYVGTPATVPSTNLVYIQAGTRMSDEAVPTGKMRYVVVNPTMEGQILDTQATQFNSQVDITEQNRSGSMGRAFGLNFAMDQNVYAHTVGALGGTPLVNGANQTGSSIATDGWTASVTNVLRKGDILTFASVNAVNPISKVNIGRLRQFVVTADVNSNGSGQATVPIYPSIVTSGARQTCTQSPADNAVILIFGHASNHAGVVTPQGIAYHKGFATFATVDLYVPRGVEMGSRAQSKELNLSVRHVRFFDGRKDQLIDRYDVLGGWKTLRPEMAVRVVS